MDGIVYIMSKKCWVLTRSVNEYDQYGEYFEAVFVNKPSLKTLADYFKYNDRGISVNVFEAISFLEHVLAGGGRQDTEYEWYDLQEVEMK